MNDNPRDLRCRACGASVRFWDVNRVDPDWHGGDIKDPIEELRTVIDRLARIERLCAELAKLKAKHDAVIL